MVIGPYTRITRRDSVTLNLRTLEMLIAAERRIAEFFPLIVPRPLSQGSYTSSVEASGGTHDGGGALDMRARDLTSGQIDRCLRELRRVGFAAWYRTTAQGFTSNHIHAIAIGDREMSDAAARQVVAYLDGRNGLKNNLADDGPKVAWTEYRQELDMSFYGPANWDAADFTKLARELFGEDGIVDPPDSLTTADNPRWAVSSALRKLLFQGVDTGSGLQELGAGQTALEEKLDQIGAKLGLDPTPEI